MFHVRFLFYMLKSLVPSNTLNSRSQFETCFRLVQYDNLIDTFQATDAAEASKESVEEKERMREINK